MIRRFSRYAVCASLAFVILPSPVQAGRGGGRGGFAGGGGMQRGGGGAGMQRGGGGAGMQRGGAGGFGGAGGGMQRGGAGGAAGAGGFGGTGAGRTPSFSQPRYNAGNGGNPGVRNPYANRPNGGAAAGAGFADRNQNPGTGAAAGAGYADRRANQLPNSGAGAAGAAYANNRNGLSNAGAAAVGAGYANRNQVSPVGAAAVGAGYANRNNYNVYHPGMSYGYWNGNYGAAGLGAFTGMAMASAAYGYGGGGAYTNPYAGGEGGQAAAVAGGPNYSQPIDPSAAPPATAPAEDPNSSAIAQARQAFAAGDYDGALKLTQQALAGLPNDVTLHEFLGLILFAQGQYEAAAAPLYAVLSAGPGWDWTTLIGNYPDAGVYTQQLRGLEAFVKANPKSAKAQFVLSYHYITQGQPDAAVKHLQAVVALQPDDAVSAQLLSKLQPPPPGDASVVPTSLDPAQLVGTWTAQAPADATITLTLSDDGKFTWIFAPKGQKSTTIQGTYAVADGVLTLNGTTPPGGPLAGQVALGDAKHMGFRAVNAPSSDPGLQFTR